LQVPLVGFAAFEDDFCGHEQEYPRIHCGTFSADNPLKFSEKIGFCGLHGTILELMVEGFKITRVLLVRRFYTVRPDLRFSEFLQRHAEPASVNA
jgi:hypothetical protein